MILSFHPCIGGNRNIVCAGRSPDADDRKAVRSADAVILPQGCSRLLYETARDNCRNVFPNYDQRFKHPGKIGQIELFRLTGALHPKSVVFPDMGAYTGRNGQIQSEGFFGYPCVFKFSWGGEGEAVFLIRSESERDELLRKAARHERGGQKGFLLQEYIPAGGKTVRVVVVGRTIASYWRTQEGPERFYSSLSRGARLDADSDPVRRTAAERSVEQFCGRTAINLAGFDLLFSDSGEPERLQPLFLEINYFFGRKGLGGSQKFYGLLRAEVKKWLRGLGLPVPEKL